MTEKTYIIKKHDILLDEFSGDIFMILKKTKKEVKVLILKPGTNKESLEIFGPSTIGVVDLARYKEYDQEELVILTVPEEKS